MEIKIDTVPIVLIVYGVLRDFGIPIIGDFKVNTGARPQAFVSEGVRDKWMHIAHIYTGSNVQVYVNAIEEVTGLKTISMLWEITFLYNLEDGRKRITN